MTTTADLGKVSPTTANYSQSADWNVFVFTRNGLRYIEPADLSGVPRAAFTATSGTLLTLPIGTDTVQQVLVAPATAVYEDSQLRVGVATQPDGTVVWQVYVK